MTRASATPPDDRIVEGQLGDPPVPLFRIAGVEPHGWSTILLEDNRGRYFIAATASRRLSELTLTEADELITNRTYRSWHGARDWAPLDRLPLLRLESLSTPPPQAEQAETAT